jgi:hypothetical protein
VRCDLGPVDAPHDPPCKRCLRESKECFFSSTRRKRKSTLENDNIDDGELSDYELRNARKKTRSDPSFDPDTSYNLNQANNAAYHPYPLPQNGERPVTPGGGVGRSQPLKRPGANPRTEEEQILDQKLNNETAGILQTGEVFSGFDALNLLYEASLKDGDVHHRNGSSGSIPRPMAGNTATPTSQPSFTSPPINEMRPPVHMQPPSAEPAVDPAITHSAFDPTDSSFEDAIKAWTKLRFVRAGWFTAEEGLAYIDYFHRNLSPLTPIVLPDLGNAATHAALPKDEPVLTVTLLMIASRYMPLKGPGSYSRAPAIHEKLWKYLQRMIDRLLWGQEQFGGGFCGAGAQQAADVNPLARKGLRTLGTVESLMLLTEWHPRALHFPPGDDEDDLILPDDSSNEPAATPGLYKGIGGQRMDAWLEPCWRSDRLCWMLLGNAMALSFEIGVFDEKTDEEVQRSHPQVSPTYLYQYLQRKNRLKELLIVYVTQTSGRLGLTSMMPKMEDKRAILTAPELQYYGQSLSGIRSPPIPQNQMQSIIQDGFGNIPSGVPKEVQDTVIAYWVDLAKQMERGNKILFPNREVTRDIIRSGEYSTLLVQFLPQLKAWKDGFDRSVDSKF